LCHPQVGRRGGPRATPGNVTVRDQTYVRVSWHKARRVRTLTGCTHSPPAYHWFRHGTMPLLVRHLPSGPILVEAR
jgi:hypothetical protein